MKHLLLLLAALSLTSFAAPPNIVILYAAICTKAAIMCLSSSNGPAR